MVTIPDRIGVVLVGTDGVPYEIGASSGGVSQQDNTAFTAGTDSGTPVEGIYEATPSTITDGRVGVVGITANRVLKAALHDAAGSAITTLPVSLTSTAITGTVAVTQSGTWDEVGINDSGNSITVDNDGTFAVQAAGNVAHDAADSGNPVKIGGKANSSAPTSVSAGDRADLWTNLGGAVVISGGPTEMSGDGASVGVPLVQRIGNTGSGPLGVLPILYNGSTFDRARGDTTNGLDVDVTRLPSATIAGTTAATGSGTATGALRVELPTNGTGIVGLAAGTNGIGKLTANSGVDIGDVDVTSIIPGTGATNLGKAEDAAHTTGDIGVMSLGVRAASPTERSAGPTDGDYEPFATNAVGAVWVTQTPTTVGGLSTFMASGSDGSSILVATKQTIKNSAGQLYGWYVFNPEAATTFVHFYNTDTVTVGTTNPQMTLAIPAGAAANVMGENGIAFSTAISCAATTTAAGNSAPATGVSLVAWYK